MTSKTKKKVEVFLNPEIHQKLKTKADSLGIGMATVIKLALEGYLK